MNKTSLYLKLWMLFCISVFQFEAETTQAQNITVEPANWWVGMKMNEVQLLIHFPEAKEYSFSTNYPGVKITKQYSLESNNYRFINVNIAPTAKAGKVNFIGKKGASSKNFSWELQARVKNPLEPITGKDIVYLIMPDRFANGDESNDNVEGYPDKINRKEAFDRHGGDLKGIEQKLDYLQNLGITTLWLNPVLENNMKKHSYHGYAITDLYKVDARFGSNESYKAFAATLHNRKMKIVKDMVLNHIGLEHKWMSDIPSKKWIHYYEEKNRPGSNFRATVVTDPYASKNDKETMLYGWFANTMPDLDQTQPELATYLIQNAIWWIEYTALDGIRMDTYPYSDKAFLANWTKAIRREYPNFYIVGEVWVPTAPLESYWTEGAANVDGYKGGLPAITDFVLMGGISSGINEGAGWDNGMMKVYNALAHDFMYKYPERNLTFLDNHDIARFMHVCQNDVRKMKLALTLLYTTRGIPQLYYGTELLMNGDGDHGRIRYDFPGGWKGDTIDAFTPQGRTKDQNEVHDLMAALGKLRQKEAAISSGKLTHYLPNDNVYVYFRKAADKTVMVVLNGNNSTKELNLKRFADDYAGFQKAKQVIGNASKGELSSFNENISLPAFGYSVWELQK